ncbi:MAG TPA: Holliday junction resolvase RuvX [Pyrinomonadaceae bacterium]|nr:Holliday junction resolvase RuvX [Pyrinomonadaceae bacterium]
MSEPLPNELRERGRLEQGRVLSLDLGEKRVGVAVSDESRLSVRPLEALPRTSWKRLLAAVSELCGSFDVVRVVVGLPLRLDGGEGEAAADARRIARNLELSIKLPVSLQDERLTSKAAEEELRAAGLTAEEIRKRVDSEAAAIILRDFLEGGGAENINDA